MIIGAQCHSHSRIFIEGEHQITVTNCCPLRGYTIIVFHGQLVMFFILHFVFFYRFFWVGAGILVKKRRGVDDGL